jgi:hypothetical protein
VCPCRYPYHSRQRSEFVFIVIPAEFMKPSLGPPHLETACPIPSQPNRLAWLPVGHRSKSMPRGCSTDNMFCTTQHTFRIIKGRFLGCRNLGRQIAFALAALSGFLSRVRLFGRGRSDPTPKFRCGRASEPVCMGISHDAVSHARFAHVDHTPSGPMMTRRRGWFVELPSLHFHDCTTWTLFFFCKK